MSLVLNTRGESYCGADVDGGTGCAADRVGTYEHTAEVHPGYLRSLVESSSTTRIEKNGGSTNSTTLAAGDVPRTRLDWSGTPMPQVQWLTTGYNGTKKSTPTDNGLLVPSAKAHFLKHTDSFGTWTKSATCTVDSGKGRCDATFPAIDQSYVDDAAYDVVFEFTGPTWESIPIFQFRSTGHNQPYPPTVWDSAPDGAVSSTHLLGTPTVTIDTTGGATTTTTAPPPSSGGMLLGWYQGGGGFSNMEGIIQGYKGSSFNFGHARVFVPKGAWGEGVETSKATASTASLSADGKSVSFSIKGNSWNGNVSPWAQMANDTAEMDRMLRQLESSASSNSIPFHTITLHHEPHDDAAGYDAAPDKDGVQSKCDAHDCAGTVAEYQLMYHNVWARRAVACGSAPNYGSECTHVKIAYIGVVSHLTNHKKNQPVGTADTMLPADRDASGAITQLNFDILAADPYNWGCFNQQTAGADGKYNTADDGSECVDDSPGAAEHEWESFETMVDAPGRTDSLLDLAERLNKPVFITEVGSHPGCTGNTADDERWPRLWCNGSSTNDAAWHRGTWFTNMASYLKNDAEAKRYIYSVDYYHTDHYDPVDNPKGHDWTFVSWSDHTAPLNGRGRSEWVDGFAKDSFFKETAVGFSVDFTPNP